MLNGVLSGATALSGAFWQVDAAIQPLWVAGVVIEPTFPGEYLSGKAPTQVEPGVTQLNGQYINDQGRVEPWSAIYDEYGRLIARTDYNAGNMAAGIPDVHYHTYGYSPGANPQELQSHVPGEYPGVCK